jgi:hypothetical protein
MSIVQDLCPALTNDEIERIARESEFCKRVKKYFRIRLPTLYVRRIHKGNGKL